MSFKAELTRAQIKHFKSALQCLGRIGMSAMIAKLSGCAFRQSQIMHELLDMQALSCYWKAFLKRYPCLPLLQQFSSGP